MAEFGNGERLTGPIEVDSTGNLYALAIDEDILGSNNVVKVFSACRSFAGVWGSTGTDNGQFSDIPKGITVDASGMVYVADTAGAWVQKFTPTGQFLVRFGIAEPEGVAVDGTGNVYVALGNRHRIQKYNAEGEFLTAWGERGGDDGQFWLLRDIEVDGSGNVYVLGLNRVQKFSSRGEFVTSWGGRGSEDGQFENALDLAIDEHGDVYVADTGNLRVQKFNSSGEFLGKYGNVGPDRSRFLSPRGVAVDGLGRVYVTDLDMLKVFRQGPSPEDSSRPTFPVADVDFVGIGLVGWAVGADGLLLRSRDGGCSWSQQESPVDANLHAVDFIDGEHGWAVGAAGTVLSTMDGGASWQEQPSAGAQDLLGVSFLDERHGWVVTERQILHTTDAGATWVVQAEIDAGTVSDVQVVGGFFFGDLQSGVVAHVIGTQGTWTTRNGGASWVLRSPRRGTAIGFLDEQAGWFIESDCTLWSTVDGGVEWVKLETSGLPAPGPCAEAKLHRATARLGWIVLDEGMVLKTVDGGESWSTPAP